MSYDIGNCPECNEPAECIQVDIGIGVEYGPPYCANCGWSSYGNAGKIIDGWYHDASGIAHKVERMTERASYLDGQDLADIVREVFESK